MLFGKQPVVTAGAVAVAAVHLWVVGKALISKGLAIRSGAPLLLWEKLPARSNAVGTVTWRTSWGRSSRCCSSETKKNNFFWPRGISLGIYTGPPKLAPAVIKRYGGSAMGLV